MNFLKTFFGQILRKTDVDFQNLGGRDANVQTHIDLTDRLGGAVNGLDVFKSVDSTSLLITPGVFYSKGDFSDANNLGGGERAQVFTTQTFTGLPQTPPLANQASFLLVYARVTSQNNNPDPNKFQSIVTAKNIQTGENVPVREYAVGTIVISNPILASEVSKFNGVPLALIQVDYNGTNLVSSNNIVQVIDVSVKQSYVLGGAVNIEKNELVDAGVPNDFLTTRMFKDNQITGPKFNDSSITTAKFAVYDGSSLASVATSGSGIATAHLKDRAVTEVKINYTGSMHQFSQTNLTRNAEFGLSSTALSFWNKTTSSTGTITLTNAEPSTDFSLFGNRSAKIIGNTNNSVAQDISINQIVDFNTNLKDRPVSAFFYLKTTTPFSPAIPQTSGISGKLEFLSDSDAVVQTEIFATYSGASVDWLKLETENPIIYSGIGNASKIRYTIGGKFANTVYVDGAYLGTTSLIPDFSVHPQEQISINSSFDASQISSGEFPNSRIADGAITTRNIRLANGGVISGPGDGIIGEQIRDNSVSGDKIKDFSIPRNKLAASGNSARFTLAVGLPSSIFANRSAVLSSGSFFSNGQFGIINGGAQINIVSRTLWHDPTCDVGLRIDGIYQSTARYSRAIDNTTQLHTTATFPVSFSGFFSSGTHVVELVMDTHGQTAGGTVFVINFGTAPSADIHSGLGPQINVLLV